MTKEKTDEICNALKGLIPDDCENGLREKLTAADEKYESVLAAAELKSVKKTTIFSVVFGLFGGGSFYLNNTLRGIIKCVCNVILPLIMTFLLSLWAMPAYNYATDVYGAVKLIGYNTSVYNVGMVKYELTEIDEINGYAFMDLEKFFDESNGSVRKYFDAVDAVSVAEDNLNDAENAVEEALKAVDNAQTDEEKETAQADLEQAQTNLGDAQKALQQAQQNSIYAFENALDTEELTKNNCLHVGVSWDYMFNVSGQYAIPEEVEKHFDVTSKADSVFAILAEVRNTNENLTEYKDYEDYCGNSQFYAKCREANSIANELVNDMESYYDANVVGAAVATLFLAVLLAVDAAIILVYWIFEVFRDRESCRRINLDKLITLLI